MAKIPRRGFLKQAGTAIVTMRSLDPNVLDIAGETRKVVEMTAGGSSEVRFDVYRSLVRSKP